MGGSHLHTLFTHKYMRHKEIQIYLCTHKHITINVLLPNSTHKVSHMLAGGMEGVTAVSASHWLGLDPEA